MLRWDYSTNLPCNTSQAGMQEKTAVFISPTYMFLYINLIFITFMHNLIRIFNKLYCFHLPGYDMIKFWKYLLRATGYSIRAHARLKPPESYGCLPAIQGMTFGHTPG